jgi:O-methyltransferase involved in polyketide biosynthesis
MKFWIPELSQNTPVLIVSHGGARYFAENGENRFLESVSAFPKESRVIVTEVGFELYKLMYNLACTADSIPNLDVFDFSDIESTSHHNCWNLSYYYFLTQQFIREKKLFDFPPEKFKW